MELPTLVTLAVLALIDSTSFGTLLIPLWLMLAPGVLRARRILLFLGVVAGFYLLLGLGLSAGLAAALPRIDRDTSVVALRVQFVVGAALLIGSFFIGRRTGAGERMGRWRERAVGADAKGARPLMLLALTAAGLEAATMLPYLAAVGIIAGEGLGGAGTTLTLAAYCLVMVLPALILLALRLGAGRRLESVLHRFAGWTARQSSRAMPWVAGVLGFLIARDAVLHSPEISAVLPWS